QFRGRPIDWARSNKAVGRFALDLGDGSVTYVFLSQEGCSSFVLNAPTANAARFPSGQKLGELIDRLMVKDPVVGRLWGTVDQKARDEIRKEAETMFARPREEIEGAIESGVSAVKQLSPEAQAASEAMLKTRLWVLLYQFRFLKEYASPRGKQITARCS